MVAIVLSIGMMVFMPGTQPLAPGEFLTIAVTFALSIGFAVMGAVLVAQRFIERHEGERHYIRSSCEPVKPRNRPPA